MLVFSVIGMRPRHGSIVLMLAFTGRCRTSRHCAVLTRTPTSMLEDNDAEQQSRNDLRSSLRDLAGAMTVADALRVKATLTTLKARRTGFGPSYVHFAARAAICVTRACHRFVAALLVDVLTCLAKVYIYM